MTLPSRETGEAAPVAEPRPARPPQLVRELADFLVELSISMHKHAIYPAGHPLLTAAVDSVYRAMLALLATRTTLSIGVARKQLIIEGVATDSHHALLGDLAGKLHRHHIGALKFERGVTRAEMSDALAVIGVEPQRDDQPIGLRLEQANILWTHVKIFPLMYDRLELLDDDDEAGEEVRVPGMRDGRAAQLWVGLARAAIAGDRSLEPEGGALEPAAVAHAIDEHDREQAYDQVIVGYLLQIAEEVRTTAPTEGTGLKRRISKLVGTLQPETLRRLLEMGGNSAQRRRFILDASQGMSVDAVVELVQAAAEAEGQTISHSLVRMLTKLASHATTETDSRRGHAADGALREHVARLVGQWSLDDPNPVQYSAALERMSRGVDVKAVADADAAPRFPCEPQRLVMIALELDAYGPTVRRATTSLLESNRLGELLDLLDRWPDSSVAAEAIWEQVAATEPLRPLLAAARLDQALAQRIVERSGMKVVTPLLDALMVTAEAARRERLLAMLSSIGLDAAEHVSARLSAAEPALIQELLGVLLQMRPPAPPPEARTYLSHADPLVRREAARLLMNYELTREGALLVGVRDPDLRVVAAALREVQETCPAQVAATIRRRVDRGELADDNLSIAAVRAVCNSVVPGRGDSEVVEWLVQRSVRPSPILRRPCLAPISPELLTALAALAAKWNTDPRAALPLQLARAHTNGAVRVAATSQRMSTPGSVMRTSIIR